MQEPEEPDESTSSAMRRVFDELEAEFDDGLRREAEQEAVAALRAELGSTVLWEQLARRVGSGMVAFAGGRVSGAAPSRAIRSSSSCATPTAPST
jgi:hypothetical protein